MQIVQMWHLDNGAKRYIYKVLVQIVQMWHLDNGAKRYIYKDWVQMVQTKNFRRLRRADCLVLISSLHQSLSPGLFPLILGGLLIYRNRIGSLLSVHFASCFFGQNFWVLLFLGGILILSGGYIVKNSLCSQVSLNFH